MNRKYQYPFGSRCCFCGKFVVNQEKVVTKRKTVYYFHKNCYLKNLNKKEIKGE